LESKTICKVIKGANEKKGNPSGNFKKNGSEKRREILVPKTR
jgi:hypothetical protein